MADKQQVTEWDEQGNPVQATATMATEWDASGNPVSPNVPRLKPSHDPMPSNIDRDKLGISLVNSHAMGIPPSVAYDNHDAINSEFANRGVDVAKSTRDIGHDIKVGAENSLFGLAYRQHMPESMQNPDLVDKFISSLSTMVSDLPFYVFGAAAGAVAGSEVPGVGNVAGAAMGTFAVPAAMRESLTLGIQRGEIKSFGDLMDRTIRTTWEGAKGALLGRAAGLAGSGTVSLAKAVGPAAPALEATAKMAQQAAALTTLSAAMEGRMPTEDEFVSNMALVGTLGIVAHGVPLVASHGKQALMDVYAKDGTMPQETATRLQAQPPVKEPLSDGLRPAIRVTASDGTKQIIHGEEGESHEELAQSVTGDKPVDMDTLNANPKLADKVLQQPEIHSQDVIDRAYELRPESRSSVLYHGARPESIKGIETDGALKGNVYLTDDPQVARDYADARGETGKIYEIDKSSIPEDVLDAAIAPGRRGVYSISTMDVPVAREYVPPVPNDLKSGRGYAVVKGDTAVAYLNRKQGERWVKANEPDVHAAWKQDHPDDKAEMHATDYYAARQRVADRNVAEGDPQLSGVSQELQQFLAKNREGLNKVKASDGGGDAYGKSVLRTTLVGPRNMVHAFGEQLASKVAKLVPEAIDQEALSFMRDYRDAPDELRQEIEAIRNGDNAKLQRAIPSMERALSPTPQMVEADKVLTDYFTQANDMRRQFVGTDSGIDPSRYSPRMFNHVVDEEQSGRSSGQSKFAKRSPHDIRREYLHVLDPLKSGEVEARTFNAVDEMRVYNDRLATSVANSVFQMELKNTELGRHGVAGQVPPELRQQMADMGTLSQDELEQLGAIPRDWVELPGTGKTIVSGDSQMRVGLQVPPKVAEAMRPIFENDVISGAKYWKLAKYAQAYIKSIELGLSPFHMRALSLSFLNNSGIDAYREALTSSNDSPQFEAQERKAALHGVTTTKTSKPYEAYQGLKPSSMEPRDTLLAKAKAGYEPVDAVFKAMTKATFDVAQRKFKVIDFSIKEAQWLAKHPEASDVEYGTAMRGIAKEVNAVYGGLNWDVMGVSANYQAVARMILLAPDWTFSNVANLKYAGEGGPGGNAARAFWLKSFVTGVAMTQGMSMLVTGQASKQWDKVYLGKDDKGKELYSSMFFVGAPKDAIGAMTSTMRDGFPIGIVKFAINKASPLTGPLIKLAENKDWQGKPIVKQQDTTGEKTKKGIKFLAEQWAPAPFVVKDIANRMMNPDESLTYKDFLGALVGASVYHEGAKQQPGQGFKVEGGTSTRRKGFSIKKGQ